MTPERKALFYTNAAYLLADVAHSFALESESSIKLLGKRFRHEDKQRFAYAEKMAKAAKTALRAIAQEIYHIQDTEAALEESDYFAEAIKMVADRTGGTLEDRKKVLAHISELPSVAGFYEDIKNEI